MIEIEFKIKKSEITKDILKLVKTADKDTILITYFLMPTKFLIDGKDIFFNKKYPEHGPWYEMPLVDWAAYFLSEIRALPQKRKINHGFWHMGHDDILLEMLKDNKVKLTDISTRNQFIVDYEELLNAFLKFEKKVKRFLNKYVPELKEHPYWGNWLKNKAQYDVNKGLIPIKE